jgi:hypothetical protein
MTSQCAPDRSSRPAVEPDVEALTGVAGVTFDGLMFLAELRFAPPQPRRQVVSDDVLLRMMVAAAHSGRRLARVLASSPLSPDARRFEATAAEARRRGMIPPRACQQRARPVGAMRRGAGRRCRPGARRRTKSPGRASSDPDGEPEPAEGRHRRLAAPPRAVNVEQGTGPRRRLRVSDDRRRAGCGVGRPS